MGTIEEPSGLMAFSLPIYLNRLNRVSQLMNTISKPETKIPTQIKPGYVDSISVKLDLNSKLLMKLIAMYEIVTETDTKKILINIKFVASVFFSEITMAKSYRSGDILLIKRTTAV